jgi:membrane-bound serine protease (ClpP class)
MDAGAPGFGIPLALIGGLALASLATLLMLGSFAARSYKRPVVSGREEMTGALGKISGPADNGDWWVTVHGENWRARSPVPLAPGTTVRVERLDGLTLDVSPTDNSPKSSASRSTS